MKHSEKFKFSSFHSHTLSLQTSKAVVSEVVSWELLFVNWNKRNVAVWSQSMFEFAFTVAANENVSVSSFKEDDF